MNDNLKVFIINGSGGSGKDTFCNYIEQLATEQNKRYHVESIYTSTPAKEWAKKMGWGETNVHVIDVFFAI